jgi:hypothetical protein|tara:strand:+ start:323 stop:1282 length:960 start_codon:yes stop_codon:yes gene_type:complete
MQMLTEKNIKKIILENYFDYQYLFLAFQSKLLSGMYSRYQSLENGNLVLYFEKKAHQDILGQKNYDLNFNISYEKFWENHSVINPKQRSLVKIATEINLPKETVRRKILELTEQKILSKKNKNTGWLPNEQYKKDYNLFVQEEIEDVSRIIFFVCKKLNHPISRDHLTKELKEKFSFYWFHYLGVQLKYLRAWNKQFNDLELILIFLQVSNLFMSKAKEKNLSHKNLYNNPNLIKNFETLSIGATSISEITKIPRATCVRKLEILIKLKLISQDKISKRYYIIPDAISESLVSTELNKLVVILFSKFFFICIKAVNVKV